MSDFDFNIDEINDALKYMDEIVKKLPKEANKFLKKEGNKLKKEITARARSNVKKKTGNYIKGIKTGKPYNYKGKDKSIRVYNSAPHAHLIEDGHVQVDRNGKSHGFVEGKHIFEDSQRKFNNTFFKDCEDFVDDLLNDGKL